MVINHKLVNLRNWKLYEGVGVLSNEGTFIMHKNMIEGEKDKQVVRW